MATTTISNNRIPKKSLADLIDRLDNILDGLADNLNESVAAAATVAAKGAVHEAVTNVFSNSGFADRLLKLTRKRNATLRTTANMLANSWIWLKQKTQDGWSWFGKKINAYLPIFIILFTALLFGILSYYCGPIGAAFVGGIGGAAVAILGLVIVPLMLVSVSNLDFNNHLSEVEDLELSLWSLDLPGDKQNQEEEVIYSAE